MPNNPTFTVSIRLNHKTLAALHDFYTSKGIVESRVASITRMALDDFAEILILQNHAKNFTLEEAIAVTRKLRFQDSRRGELMKTLANDLAIEQGSEPIHWDTDALADQVLSSEEDPLPPLCNNYTKENKEN